MGKMIGGEKELENSLSVWLFGRLKCLEDLPVMLRLCPPRLIHSIPVAAHSHCWSDLHQGRRREDGNISNQVYLGYIVQCTLHDIVYA